MDLVFKQCYSCMRELPEPDAVCPYCGYDNAEGPKSQPAHALPCGTVLAGRYVLGKVMSQDAVGIRYIAYDLKLGAPAAIKEYFPAGAAARSVSRSYQVTWNGESGAQGRESFVRSAQSEARILDAFAENDTAYVVTDSGEGGSPDAERRPWAVSVSRPESWNTAAPQPAPMPGSGTAPVAKTKKSKSRLGLILGVAAVLIAAVLAVVFVWGGGKKAAVPLSPEDQAYADAEALLSKGEKALAALAFGKMGDYKDARERSFALWREVGPNVTLAAGYFNTVALNADGSAVGTSVKGSNNHGQSGVSEWRNLIAISTRDWHSVGLKKDGTAVATVYTGDQSNNNGQCDVAGWKDLIAVEAGNLHSVGLKKDGTLIATGSNNNGQCKVTGWKDIAAISAGALHTVGLKKNGTVVATGWNNASQCKVDGWTDIVAVSAGVRHTVGLKADGTVVCTPYTGESQYNYGQCDVTDWTDIVAIDAGSTLTVGLKADGTVVAVGENDEGECEVGDWTDIVAVAAGSDHIVGLKADGTVVVTGSNDCGQSAVTGWTGVRLPGA